MTSRTVFLSASAVEEYLVQKENDVAQSRYDLPWTISLSAVAVKKRTRSLKRLQFLYDIPVNLLLCSVCDSVPSLSEDTNVAQLLFDPPETDVAQTTSLSVVAVKQHSHPMRIFVNCRVLGTQTLAVFLHGSWVLTVFLLFLNIIIRVKGCARGLRPCSQFSLSFAERNVPHTPSPTVKLTPQK